ncbi:hypothetical protein ACG0Y9_28100, partial [Klebsiella pneumoniae]
MPAFEWVHVQLHQQKGMISLSPPTICNSADHSTIYRWVQRYAPEMEKRLRWYWRNPSDLCPWHMDETYVKV